MTSIDPRLQTLMELAQARLDEERRITGLKYKVPDYQLDPFMTMQTFPMYVHDIMQFALTILNVENFETQTLLKSLVNIIVAVWHIATKANIIIPAVAPYEIPNLRKEAVDYLLQQGHRTRCVRNDSSLPVNERVCTCGYDLLVELARDYAEETHILTSAEEEHARYWKHRFGEEEPEHEEVIE